MHIEVYLGLFEDILFHEIKTKIGGKINLLHSNELNNTRYCCCTTK